MEAYTDSGIFDSFMSDNVTIVCIRAISFLDGIIYGTYEIKSHLMLLC